MARPGVGYEDIAEAANQLSSNGKTPTIELIRRVLGTGSSTTIANYLREWKIAQQGGLASVNIEELPSEILATLKDLWERLVKQSEEKIVVLKETVGKYQTNNQRWQQLYHQWLEEKKTFNEYKRSTDETIVQLRKECAALKHQLEEKQIRVVELHYLHKQAQENFEKIRLDAKEREMNLLIGRERKQPKVKKRGKNQQKKRN